MRPWRRSLLASQLALCGCIGAEYTGSHSAGTMFPCIATKPGQLFESAHDYVVTESRLREAWGEPAEVTTRDDGSRRWTYYGSMRLNGILLLVVVVPLPLFVPVGRERVSVDFKDGSAVFGEAVASEELWQVFAGLHLHDGWTLKAEERAWSGVPEVSLQSGSR